MRVLLVRAVAMAGSCRIAWQVASGALHYGVAHAGMTAAGMH